MTPLSGDAPPQASSHVSPEQAANEFLKRLSGPSRLLVAFSGGGDSTGLLAVLSAARRDHPGLSLHSATVDHGLRGGSAEEAEAAALVSRKLGVPHATLQWRGEKPTTGIQAAAREARYRLLAAEAGRIGADFIVTGHTLDDQSETVLMRRARNPMVGEGMDEAVLIERRVWVVRPFLQVGRQAIRDYLRKMRLGWSEDPSNDNPAFERVRIRHSGALVEMRVTEHGPNPNVLSAQFVRDSVRVYSGAVAVVDLRDCHPRYQPYWTALETIAAILGGREHGAGSDTDRMMVDKLAGSADFRATASRCVFDRRGSTLYLCREDRGLPQVTIAPGTSVLWDGRYEIVNGGTRAAVVGAGRAVVAAPPLLPTGPDDALPGAVVQRAEASTPRLVEGEAARLRVRRVLAPFDKFIPARKLELANSLATAFELERFPLLTLGAGAF
jgi:tRNA(Ile)-lysidine synthase